MFAIALLSLIMAFLSFFSVFYQIQTIFGHLLEGKMQYYRPEAFWKSFKFWGQPISVREQQVCNENLPLPSHLEPSSLHSLP